MAGLELNGVSKSFGETEVIRNVDLSVKDGEFVVFVGPSGCGKSTLLRLIAGLEDISDGAIEIGGIDMSQVDARDRGVAMVFQSYALYPHMTVRENVSFPLRLAGVSKAEQARAADDAARILQMEHLMDRRPGQLSGGQRQRVAIGRAIVRQPDVFLFDEPLSNLDASLRMDMRAELAELHRTLKSTMIYVTHDQVEAMTLADKIVVLDKGVVQQIGSPIELFDQPANTFVAGFLGSPRMNFLTVSAAQDGAQMRLSGPDMSPIMVDSARTAGVTGDGLTLGIRPHDLRLADTGPITGTVQMIERLGHEVIVGIKLASGASVVAALSGRSRMALDDRLSFTFDTDDCHLFDAAGAKLSNRVI